MFNGHIHMHQILSAHKQIMLLHGILRFVWIKMDIFIDIRKNTFILLLLMYQKVVFFHS